MNEAIWVHKDNPSAEGQTNKPSEARRETQAILIIKQLWIAY